MQKEKAKTFREQLSVQNFTQSIGWLNCFKKWHEITLQSVLEKFAAANIVEVLKGRKNLLKMIANYALQNVYNTDKTGLFYHLEQDATLATGPVKQKKKNKASILVGLCSNATGTDKRNPLLIARSKVFYVTYKHNSKAWMTSVVFTD